MRHECAGMIFLLAAWAAEGHYWDESDTLTSTTCPVTVGR